MPSTLLSLGELSDLGIDLADIGFQAGELDALLRAGQGDPREDDTPEVPAVPVLRPGELSCLGSHQLLCGDATDSADFKRL